MSFPYANRIAQDKGGTPMQEFPAPVLAIQRFAPENAVTSSVVSLTDRTVQLEIAAIGAPAVIKWIPTTDTQASVISAATGANYDHVIPAGTYRRFVVPIETQGTSSISGANVMNGLYRRVAWKTAGIGSVLSAEY